MPADTFQMKDQPTIDPEGRLQILLIDDDARRAEVLAAALDVTRYRVLHLANSKASILKAVDRLQPDLIVIDIESPNRDILDSLHILNTVNPKPIVMFSEQEDTDTIKQCVRSGVSAYVVGDVSLARVRGILDAAVERFDQLQGLRNELSEAKKALDSRKIVDEAKRLLMNSKGLSEQKAFKKIQKISMDTGQKMEEVAKNIISVLNALGY
jgi:response regulator NasT